LEWSDLNEKKAPIYRLIQIIVSLAVFVIFIVVAMNYGQEIKILQTSYKQTQNEGFIIASKMLTLELSVFLLMFATITGTLDFLYISLSISEKIKRNKAVVIVVGVFLIMCGIVITLILFESVLKFHPWAYGLIVFFIVGILVADSIVNFNLRKKQRADYNKLNDRT
jgi:magnesium-transporting ATPase (P-type)